VIVEDKYGNISGAQTIDFSDEYGIRLGAGIGVLIGFGVAGEDGAKAGAMLGAEWAASKEFGLSQL